MGNAAATGRALAAAGVAGLGYAALVEPRWFALRHVTVPVLRAGATRPVRVLHLSDLHLLPWQHRMRRFVHDCLRTGPDAVVVTGDVLGHPDAIDPAVQLLSDLGRDRLAVAVLGSNDRYAPVVKNPARYFFPGRAHVFGTPLDTDALVHGLTDAGWQVLCNRRIAVDSPAGLLDIAGLDDPHIDLARPDDIDWSAPDGAPVLRLGVVHAPYLAPLDAFARNGFDLVLAGHTHGGQLRVPGFGALVDNCDLPLRQARGLSRHGRIWLHVSAGLGASRYSQIRFACRPEATVLDLVPATS